MNDLEVVQSYVGIAEFETLTVIYEGNGVAIAVNGDVVEVLDLANIKKGWKVLNVKNSIGTSLKTHLCVFPIDLQDKILVYGCMKKRKLNKMVFVFDMGKNEYVHIDQTLYDELAEEAKTNKTLSYIVSTIHLHK